METKRQCFVLGTAVNGIVAALGAAVLFGASTPLAKLLLAKVAAQTLAGLLYLGSGLGLAVVLLLRRRSVSFERGQALWLALAILCGGVLGPLLLMMGLNRSSSTTASLLLNFEGVLTASLAWFVFRENFDQRVALGMLAIVAGGVALVWPSDGAGFALSSGAWYVLAACLCWGLDNNFTQKVSGADALAVAGLKGLCAGACNLGLAALSGHLLFPGAQVAGATMLVGFLGYGLSLALFVVALRSLGTARTGAYFSLAPFVGAALSLLIFGEPLTWNLGLAAGLMGWGVYLHVSEHHQHEHQHEVLEHTHEHEHDEHHGHEHVSGDPPGKPHTHRHKHERMRHTHPHYPDLHHRHEH